MDASALIAELLDAPNPRLLWRPTASSSNAAFGLFPYSAAVVHAVLEACRAAYAGERVAPFEADGYFWSLTRLSLDGGVVFAECIETQPGIPEADDDAMQSLPVVIRAANVAPRGIAKLNRLTDMLLSTQPQLFEETSLCVSRRGGPFALLPRTTVTDARVREWLRWPLSRLFEERRACIITAESGRRALAVPSAASADARFVALYVLTDAPLGRSQETFVRALESATGWFADDPPRRHDLDRIAAGAASDPRIILVGKSNENASRVARMIERRGWRVERVQRAGFKRRTQIELPAVAIVEVEESADAAALLRALRGRGSRWLFILLHDGPIPVDPELEMLADLQMSTAQTDAAIFETIKRAVRELPVRRRSSLDDRIEAFARRMRHAGDDDALVAMVAAECAAIFSAHAIVHVVDTAGVVHVAQRPETLKRGYEQLPNTFLSGYAAMRSPIDEAFLAEIFDDEHDVAELLESGIRSAASIPMTRNGRVVGTISVFSRHVCDDVEFDAMRRLTDAISDALADERRDHVAMLPHAARKRTVRVGDLAIHGLFSRGSSWMDAIALDRDRALIVAIRDTSDPSRRRPAPERVVQSLVTSLTASPSSAATVLHDAVSTHGKNGGALAAVVDASTATLTVAALGHALPLTVRAAGPSAIPDYPDGEVAVRVIPLPEGSMALVYEASLMTSLDGAELMSIAREALRGKSSSPLEHIARAAGGDNRPVSIAGIVRPALPSSG